MSVASKVTARVDVGAERVDVDWGDGAAERGVRGVLVHAYAPGTTVTITVTDPRTDLSSSTTVTVPRPPRPPQVTFDEGATPPARKSKNDQGATS